MLRCESLLGLDQATCSRVLNKNYKLLVSMAPLSNEIRPISSCTPQFPAPYLFIYMFIYFTLQHIGPAIPEVSSIWFKLYLYHVTGQGPPSLLLSKGSRLRKLPDIFQGHGMHGHGETVHIPFPFDEEDLKGALSSEDEWVPLELCFGMPLFSSELNRRVCRKIASHKLCSNESLQELLHSSRKLSLKVLSFVHLFQDGGQPSDPDSGVSNPLSQPPAESGVPLPSLNLLFKDGQLKEWSGRPPPPLDISSLQKDQPS
ncbi:hypothetical protein GOODEAATRI_005230 [Goodea atripinnis]|uniref:FAM91 C-terminal domain-containing protein n=1 Tax=Goodea atripinnis TaxID=208336 RepID=A0ABV0MYU0_9TELE